ncbi:MAG: hypothetical protein AAGF58_11345, partial [Pseudomonadota bacterium]
MFSKPLVLAIACVVGGAIAVGALPAIAAEPQALLGNLIVWIYTQQKAFHRELTQGLRAIGSGGGVAASIGLIVASFLYGVFHAAGPGHGKAILSTYLLTHRSEVKKGVMIAAAAALFQGFVALVLVYGLVGVVGLAATNATGAVTWTERLSYALVFVIGALL